MAKMNEMRILSIFLYGISFVFVLGTPYAAYALSSDCKQQCPLTSNTSSIVMPPMVAAVFDPFNATELELIAAHVKSKLSLLDSIPEDTLFGEYLYAVDFLPDAKSTVLKSIDGGQDYPGRFAKATVFHCISDAEAKLVEYKVGPIKSFPLVASAVPVVAMQQPGNYARSTSLPGTMRPMTPTEYSLMDTVISSAMQQLSNLTTVSYDTTYEEGEMIWTDTSPRGYTKSTRQTWIWLMWSREGMYALPLGLSMLIEHKSLDSSRWKVLQCSYNGQGPFNSVDALANAFNEGSLSIMEYRMPPAEAAAPLWSSMRRRGNIRPLEDLQPPKTLNLGGPRYVVRGQQVAWLGWDLHIGYELIAGIKLNDIRFRGERIVYELALQDAYASYSGASPIQSLSQYSDAGWGMGWSGKQLMLGVDCPAHAAVLDINYFVEGSLGTVRNSICIWEQPDNVAIMRHYDNDWEGGDTYSFVAGTPRTALVIRTTSTVYNYDYYYSYIFYSEGTIKVEAMASGYLQSDSNPSTTALRNTEKGFQTPVHQFTSGNLHDHMFSYKVDLDVLGPLNSLLRSEVKVKQFPERWNFDGSLKKKKYVDNKIVKREGRQSWYNVNPAKPVTLSFVKESRTNSWGQPRGYVFHLGATATQLLDDSMPWMPSQQWTKYNVAVTKRKESEPKSGYPLYDQQAPVDAVVNFDSYINGERLVNRDLVAWIMIGNIHIPSAEDVPVTTTAHTALSFLIKPMNYFDESPATDLTTSFYKTGNTFPSATSTEIDTTNAPLSEQCFDATPVPHFDS